MGYPLAIVHLPVFLSLRCFIDQGAAMFNLRILLLLGLLVILCLTVSMCQQNEPAPLMHDASHSLMNLS